MSAPDLAHVTIRIGAGGVMRVYVGPRLLAGVTAVRSEYACSVVAWTLTLAGAQVRVAHEDDGATEDAAEPIAVSRAMRVARPVPEPAVGAPLAPALVAAVKATIVAPAKPDVKAPALGPWKPLAEKAHPHLALAEFKDGSGTALVRLRGDGVRVNFRQALLVRALAAGMPYPIDRKALIGRLWSVPPAGADAILSQVGKALGELVGSEGLTVKVVKGVGIALQVID